MTSTLSISDQANRRNLRLMITLRGLAFTLQVGIIAVTYYGFNIVLPFWTMVLMAAVLAIFNLYSFLRVEAPEPVGQNDLLLALVVDVLVLSFQLHFSGGTTNPFVSFYMLPVILGAVMLDTPRAWFVYGLTIVGYVALAIFHHPDAALTVMHSAHSHGGSLIDRADLHMSGMMVGYFLCAGVLVYSVTRIRKILTDRDAEYQKLKTHSLEQEHVLRLGLLAGGAAHELGTPLTTLSVILRDWLTLSPPRRKAERDAELMTMTAQVDRCKAIISDMIAASGTSRGENARTVTIHAFLKSVVTVWQDTQAGNLQTQLIGNDHLIVADRVLEQAILNLLDNALEASRGAGSDEVRLEATVTEDVLTIDITDKGAGFAAEVLDAPGQPFQSTRAASGRGLGLFLVRTLVQSLSGTLDIASSPQGSRVRMGLPLSSLRVTES